MAKKTKEAAPAETTEIATPAVDAKVERARKAKEDVFARRMIDGVPAPLEQGKRLAPQAQAIVSAVEAAGSITRQALDEALTATGVLKSRQPTGRIITYYQNDLVNLGLITITKA